MKCEKCGAREATCFYSETVNGKETRAYLCPECAAEREQTMPFAELFSGGIMGQLLKPKYTSAAKPAEEKRCSLCSSTFNTIVKNGKAGCPQCYVDFAPQMGEMLRRLHGNTSHKGMSPREDRLAGEEKSREATLSLQLQEAIRAEEYERAAVIRDELRALRGEG